MNEMMKSIEALLFAWGDTISITKLCEICDLNRDDIKQILVDLNKKYDENNSAFEIIYINESVQLVARDECHEIIGSLFETLPDKIMSKSFLEVLSIVAYNQDISKSQIEHIRGVNSDRTLARLVNDGFIRAYYNREINSRSKLYRTTDLFLKKFGLKNLSELPKIEDKKDFLELRNDIVNIM